MENKLITVRGHESWYASLERAYVSITTPKGMTLTIDKWPSVKLNNRWTEDEAGEGIGLLVWKVYELIHSRGTFGGDIQLTKEEIFLFAKYSNQQNHPKVKNNLKS